MAYSKTAWANSPATSSSINQTNLNKIETSLFDQDARITVAETNLASGWRILSGTFVYDTADAPTFTMSFAGDLTGILSLGMKIKLTQTTTKFFFITKLSYGAGVTIVTLYGGTDYTLVNAAISNVYHSTERTPYGFPMDKAKWSVVTTISANQTQASPTANTIYNIGGVNLVVPIGSWSIHRVITGNPTRGTAGFVEQIDCLSTANNTFDANNATGIFAGNVVGLILSTCTEFPLVVTSKTTLYLNSKTTQSGQAQISIYNNSTFGNGYLRATIAYL